MCQMWENLIWGDKVEDVIKMIKLSMIQIIALF